MKRRDALKNTGLILGYSISAGTISSLLTSCHTAPEIDWKPEVFSPDQAKTISTFVDLIIPKTDTPGALELNIDKFIDKFVNEVYTESDKQMLTRGLDNFNDKCLDKHGASFHACSNEQQHVEMQALETSLVNLPPTFWGQSLDESAEIPFYSLVKEMTILGYFNSETIGKQHLSYLPLPGEYLGCIPLDEVGNNWSEG